jgi:hypothetical protein
MNPVSVHHTLVLPFFHTNNPNFIPTHIIPKQRQTGTIRVISGVWENSMPSASGKLFQGTGMSSEILRKMNLFLNK